MNELFRAALNYAEQGLYVFPLGPRGKIPLTDHGILDASNETHQVTQWWTRWPEANIGLSCGRCGIVVIDLDVKEEGIDNWAELAGKMEIDDNTVTSLTGGGGQHLFYKAPADIKINNSVGRLGPGIDVRAEGGYVVVPPSIHPNGNSYYWEVSHSPDNCPILPLPQALIQLLEEKKQHPVFPATGEKIPEGRRNDYLASLAGTMRRKGTSQEAIEAALLVENERLCNPPLAESEVSRIASSIAKYPPGPASPENECNSFHLTDLGNAQRVVARHGRDIRYCHPWEKWLIWDGTRWSRDYTAEIERKAKETIVSFYQKASLIDNEEVRTKLARYAISSEAAKKIAAMISLAKSEPGIPVLPENLDTDPWLLNCLNGTIDLRSGILTPHRREDMITRIIPIKFDPKAQCPLWDRFLNRIMGENQGVINFLKRAIGYSLTGDTSEQCIFVLYGSGSNGKSTFIRTSLEMIHDYGISASTDTFMTKRGESIPNDIARLAGARFVAACETEEGRRFAEVLLKQLTGGDSVSARFLRQEWFDFSPQFKIWLATNHKPTIKGTDQAIWRRIRLVPFGVTIPEGEQDKKLPERLLEELPGILNWAIKGCLDWQKFGLGEPEEVKSATAKYRAEMDVLGNFISDQCVEAPEAKVQASELYNSYKLWCEAAGEKPMTANLFGRALLERNFKRDKETTGKRLVYYYGLKLSLDELQFGTDTN